MNGVARDHGENIAAERLKEAVENLGERNISSSVERVLGQAVDLFFDVDSPLGLVYVVVGKGGVRFLTRASSAEEFARHYRDRFGRFVSPADRSVEDLKERVAQALAEGRTDVPVDLEQTTPFQRRVMEVVKGIRRGEVRPYNWVAREAGSPRASRAVGTVMANNPIPMIIPCHRVIRNDGSPGKYGFNPEEKVKLLRGEGVPVEEVARSPYVATPTTGIVCHATCHNARRIQPENRVGFRNVLDALDAGYRTCKICRPVAA